MGSRLQREGGEPGNGRRRTCNASRDRDRPLAQHRQQRASVADGQPPDQHKRLEALGEYYAPCADEPRRSDIPALQQFQAGASIADCGNGQHQPCANSISGRGAEPSRELPLGTSALKRQHGNARHDNRNGQHGDGRQLLAEEGKAQDGDLDDLRL